MPYFDAPESSDARLEIEDRGDYYSFSYSRGSYFKLAGETGITPCVEHTGPHGTDGAPPDIEAFQFALPTAYLGSQAPYPEPVVDVSFPVVGSAVYKLATWSSPPCVANLRIGRGAYRRKLAPAVDDINGDPVDQSSPGPNNEEAPAWYDVNLGTRPTGTWPALAWEIDIIEVQHISAIASLLGWARKRGTPPDPPSIPPPAPTLPTILPPCLDRLSRGKLTAGGATFGRVPLARRPDGQPR